MIGMTELLLHTGLDDQQKRFAKAAHGSGEALLGLINDILDFSKIEASKVELENVEFDLVEVIDDVCYIQSEPAQRRNLALNNICEPSIPKLVLGDPTKIRQVVMNLVSNAIKFTHQGQVDIRVTANPSPQSTEISEINISVIDTGIGMNEETRRKIFEAFTQADASTTREYGGTGLGLTISRRFIEMMDGGIEIQSELGMGTTFTVTLPLKIIKQADKNIDTFAKYSAYLFCANTSTIDMISSHLSRLGINSTYSNGGGTPHDYSCSNTIPIVDHELMDEHPELIRFLDERSGAKGIILTPLKASNSAIEFPGWVNLTKPITSSALKDALLQLTTPAEDKIIHDQRAAITLEHSSAKVLVAEDLETNQRIICEILQMLDCEVAIASNGSEAVDLFASEEFDLVFMDCQMPVMDGYEATSNIRRIEKQRGSVPIPIIALTAGTSKEDKEKCKNIGMNHYLTKPFTISDISLTINTALRAVKDDSKYQSQTRTDSPSVNSSSANLKSLGTEIVNFRAIENIREVERQTGKEILPDVFDGYIAQMKDKLNEISDNYANGDIESTIKTAHAIKSMSANIGADRVRYSGARVEADCKKGEFEEIESGIAEINTAFTQFLIEFRNLLGENRKTSNN